MEAFASEQVTELGQIVNTTWSRPWGSEARATIRGSSRTSWLLPWKDKFLHIGHPIVEGHESNVGISYGSQKIDVSRLVFRTAPDGIEWTEPDELDVPRVHFPVPQPIDWASKWSDRWAPCWGAERCFALVDGVEEHVGYHLDGIGYEFNGESISTIFDVVSNGDRIIVASQWQDNIYVSISQDLISWSTTEITLSDPSDLHQSLSMASRAMGLEIGPSGWLVTIQSVMYIDFISLLPHDIAQTAKNFIIRHQYYGCQDEDEIDGYLVNYSLDKWWSADQERCVPWKDTGIPGGLYSAYGNVANKPYHPPRRYSGSVWSASWGESPSESHLPAASDLIGEGTHPGTCCMIFGTGAGYVAIEDPTGPGYGATWGVPTAIFYSFDGANWNEVHNPLDERSWVYMAVAMDDSIFFVSTDAYKYDYGIENSSEIWVSDLGGSNWRRSDLQGFISDTSFYHPPHRDLLLWMSEHGLSRKVDRLRFGNGAIAINGNIAIWFGGGHKIERLVFDE